MAGVAEGVAENLERLEGICGRYGSALVAFSGGVDSSLVLAVAARALPRNRVLAVTSSNETYLPSELDGAAEFVRSLGVEHVVLNTRELDDPNYAANPQDRCYFCKDTLYGELADLARERGYGCVMDGANKDDEGDHRPGRRAAAEHGVVSVLAEAGLTKAEVRDLAKHLELPTWDKPALACLSSRFPYGEEITAEKLRRVARAEEFLRSLDFRQARVRYHGDVARLELAPDEMDRAFAEREKLVSGVSAAGFLYVALDLAGYRSGSLNAALEKSSKGKGRKLLPLATESPTKTKS